MMIKMILSSLRFKENDAAPWIHQFLPIPGPDHLYHYHCYLYYDYQNFVVAMAIVIKTMIPTSGRGFPMKWTSNFAVSVSPTWGIHIIWDLRYSLSEVFALSEIWVIHYLRYSHYLRSEIFIIWGIHIINLEVLNLESQQQVCYYYHVKTILSIQFHTQYISPWDVSNQPQCPSDVWLSQGDTPQQGDLSPPANIYYSEFSSNKLICYFLKVSKSNTVAL